MASSPLNSLELSQRINKTLMFSSRGMSWNGVLVEQCQSPTFAFDVELSALSDHWLNLHIGQPTPLIQKRDGRLHKSTLHEGNNFFVPAGQSSYWCRDKSGFICTPLLICLKPELIQHVAEASDIDPKQFDLVPCFGQQDRQLHRIRMLLLAELQSGGMMGRLYVESLTQVLVIHLLASLFHLDAHHYIPE